MSGVSAGPTPWWQLPGGAGSRANLEASAPAGYAYDPVQMQYARTPTTQGKDVNAYNEAAYGPLMTGLQGAYGSGGIGVGAGSGGAGSPGGGTPLVSMGSGYGSGGTTPPPAREATAPHPGTIPHFEQADMTAANAAAFAHAKDQVGQTARGALTGLQGAMAGRGILGSGVEGRATQGVINAGQGQLGDVSRQQAQTGAELAQKVAEMNYQGDISQRGQDTTMRGQDMASGVAQRGQDIGFNTAQYSGNISQRGQDMNSGDAAANRALEMLKLQYQQRSGTPPNPHYGGATAY